MRIANTLSKTFLALLLAVCAGHATSHTFDASGLIGEKLQVKLEPMYSGGNLIGLEVYELWIDEEVGHAFLSKRAFYRFDTKVATEDRDWYYLNGYLGEASLEVENKYETQHWSITSELATTLDRASRLVANPKASIEELKNLYQSLARTPFAVKAGEKEREGQRQSKWVSGLQRIGQAEIVLSRSPKYGNRFAAKLAN
jgi:hypothetical protein